MKILLFGGAFDPPHLGHQSIARNAIAQHIADEVWFVPVRQHSFQKKLSDPTHRLAMLSALLVPGSRIELYEIESEGVNYTFNTLDALSEKYPEHQFSWIIGSDNLGSFHKWGDAKGRDYTQLLATHPFYVYPREGYPFNPLYDGMIPLREMPEVTVSSTQVRTEVMAGRSVAELVPKEIARYIEQNQLYRPHSKE